MYLAVLPSPSSTSPSEEEETDVLYQWMLNIANNVLIILDASIFMFWIIVLRLMTLEKWLQVHVPPDVV